MHQCKHPLRHTLLVCGSTALWLLSMPLVVIWVARTWPGPWMPRPFVACALAVLTAWFVRAVLLGMCASPPKPPGLHTAAVVTTWVLHQEDKS